MVAVRETEVETVPPKPPNKVAHWWRTFGRPPRIMGVDVARALAIIGMIGAHVGETPEFVWADPSTWGGVVHGRSSVLFAILAGVSVSLVTGRSSRLSPELVPAARLRLVGRGAAVLVIGVLLEMLNTNIAVILTVYGILFVVATAFLHWSVRRLFVVGILLGVLGPPLMAFLHGLTLGAWGPALDFLVYGTYPVTVWIAYLLIGMGVGRLRIDTRRVAAILLGAGVAVAFLGYGLASLVAPDDGDWDGSSSSWEDPGYITKPGSEVNLDGFVCDVEPGAWVSCYPEYEYVPDDADSSTASSDVEIDEILFGDLDASYGEQIVWEDLWLSVRDSVTNAYPHSGGVLDIVGSSGFALAVLGACLLLAAPLRWPLLPVAALGSMPVTVYTLHVTSVMIMSGGPGSSIEPSNLVWLWSVVALMAAALLWATAFGKGPLERLVARAGAAMARAPR